MKRQAPPRWVLDTNVVLSALIRPGGVSGRLRLAWQAALFVPLVSRATTLELVRVLAYPKFRLGEDEQHDLLADYLPWAEPVTLPAIMPPVPPCRDRDDAPFLQLAVMAQAEALVTGDRDLLVLGDDAPCPLLTPAEAVAHLSR